MPEKSALPVHAEVHVVVYCRICGKFVEAAPLPVEDEDGEPNRHLYFKDEPDLAWVRRRRMCLGCGTTFSTAEVDETLVDELRQLRHELEEHPTMVPPSWMSVAIADVPLDYAEQLVKEAAWWLRHPRPCRAPGMADKIQNVPGFGWCVPYGANWFAAAYAIHQVGIIVADAAAKYDEGRPLPRSAIERKIYEAVWSSVLNSECELYPPCSYRKDDEDLIFGTHSIDVDDATDFLFSASGAIGVVA